MQITKFIIQRSSFIISLQSCDSFFDRINRRQIAGRLVQIKKLKKRRLTSAL